MMLRIILFVTLLTNINAETSRSHRQITIIGSQAVTTNFSVYVNAKNLNAEDNLKLTLKQNDGAEEFLEFSNMVHFNKKIDYQIKSNESSFTLLSQFKTKDLNGEEKCTMNEYKIFNANSRNFFHVIQFDKLAYTPGDEVNFRILTLDHQTKPYKYDKINVEVLDPEGRIFKTFEDNRTSAFSFYKNSFKLGEKKLIGKWQLAVSIEGSTKKTSKSFNVQKPELTPLKVYIETLPIVSYIDSLNFDPSIKLKIFAKSTTGSICKGTAVINATTFYEDQPNRKLFEKSQYISNDVIYRKQDIIFELQKDLNLNFLTKTIIVNFDVTFTDDKSGKKSKASKEVKVLASGRHWLEVTKPQSFVPGLSFKFNVKVFTLDGKREKTTSIPVKMKLDYGNEFSNKRWTEQEFLSMGQTSFDFILPAHVNHFNVTFDFEGAKYEETITQENNMHSNNEALRVMFEPERPQIRSKMKITAQSNKIMNNLNVIVINQSGLVYSMEYPEAQNQKSFSFNLEIRIEMAPVSTVIVFYIRDEDGELVYDKFKLSLGFNNKNFLNFSISKNIYQPLENVSFNLSTQPNSLVCLHSAIDTSTQITSERINSQLSNLGKYKTDIFQGNLYFDLFKSNTFVFQPLKNSKPCISETIDDSHVDYDYSNDQGESDEIQWDDNEFFEDASDQKYSSNVWIFDAVEATTSTTLFNKITPDSEDSWIVSGFSLNAQNGLAIAKSQSIKVFKDISVKVSVASSVKVGEVFKLEAFVRSNLETNEPLNVKLHYEGFEIVTQAHQSYNGCKRYMTSNNHIRRLSNSDDSIEFFLRAVKGGNLEIKVELTGNTIREEIVKKIKVDYEGITEYKNHPMFINLKEGDTFNKEIAVNLPLNAHPESIKIEAFVSGNLLEPAIENFNKFLRHPEGSNESKMKSFALSVLIYKYLKSINQIDTEKARSAYKITQEGYAHALKIQTKNGGFTLWNNSESSECIWLSAYVTKILSDANEFIDIDEEFYVNSLNFLKSKYKKGELYEDNEYNPRKQQGSHLYHRIYLTGFIMIAISKYSKSDESFKELSNEILELLSKQEFQYDYERAVVAYALALSGKEDEGKRMFNTLQWKFSRMPVENIKALQVEVASYITLAAVKLNRIDDATRAVKWLIERRKSDGGFISTHDTVLGLEALAAYQSFVGTQNTPFDVHTTNGLSREVRSETDNHALELPSSTKKIEIRASANIFSYVNVFYQYASKTFSNSYFKIDHIEAKEIEGKMTLNFKVSRYRLNLAVVEVQLPSGFEFSGGSFDEAKEFKVNDEKTRVFLYFDKTDIAMIHVVSIETVKIYELENLRQSYIKAYDYFEPELFKAVFFYNLEREENCFDETSHTTQDNFSSSISPIVLELKPKPRFP